MAKKVTSKKTEAAPAAVEPKTEAAAKTIAAKPVTEKVAATEESVSAPETAPVKKAPAKKAAPKKAAAPQMPHPEVFVQYCGKEASVKEVIDNIRKAWTEETGKDVSEMKDLKIYIKPEENVAYYVINEETRSIIL